MNMQKIIQNEVQRRATQRQFVLLLVKKGLGLRGELAIDPASETIICAKTGKPVCEGVLKKVIQNPQLAKQMVSEAYQNLESADKILARINCIFAGGKYKIAPLLDLSLLCFSRLQMGSIDRVFYHPSYSKEILSRISGYARLPYPTRDIDEVITFTQTSPSGMNIDRKRTKIMLQYLGHEFSMNSGSNRAFSFQGFNWEWYKFTQVPVQRLTLLEPPENDDSLGQALNEFIERIGICRALPEEDKFKIVLDSLHDIWCDVMYARAQRTLFAKFILDHSRKKSKPAVNAMLYLAGQVSEINDMIHYRLRDIRKIFVLNLRKYGMDGTALTDIYSEYIGKIPSFKFQRAGAPPETAMQKILSEAGIS